MALRRGKGAGQPRPSSDPAAISSTSTGLGRVTSLRLKTITIIVATLAGLLIVLSIPLRSILLDSFAYIAKESANTDVRRARSTLTDHELALSRTVVDYARWDGTYAYVVDHNPAYVEANLTDSTFSNTQINLILIIDSSGELVFSEAFDLVGNQAVPLPPPFLKPTVTLAPLLARAGSTEVVTGYVVLDDRAMLLAASPILTSNDEGPARGTLVMGRLLDENVLASLAHSTQLTLTVDLLTGPQVPSGVQEASAALQAGESIYVPQPTGRMVTGYALQRDIFGRPAFLLHVQSPGAYYDLGQTSIFYFSISLLGAGLVFTVVVLVLLETVILAPLARLNRGVHTVGRKGDFAARVLVKGSDELAQLAGSINTMLDSLQHEEQLRGQAEAEQIRLQETIIQDATRRQESLRMEARRLAALSEIGQAVNSLQRVDDIFQFLVERMRDFVQFERFSIALLDPAGTTWSIAYVHGMEEVIPAPPVAIVQGLPGWAMRTGQAVLVPDMAADERATTLAEQELVARGCRSAIVVPLQTEDTIVGSLNLVGQGVEAYKDGDLAMMLLFGRQVETALQNVRLLQRERRRAEQLRALTEVSRQVSSILDVDTILQRVGQIIQETLGYHRVNVGLIEGEELVFAARVGDEGQPLAPMRLQVGEEGITGWVAGSGEPLLVNDITQETRYAGPIAGEHGRTAAELAVPIIIEGRTVGVLDVQSATRGAFDAEDVQLIQTLAGHLSVSIQNAQLYGGIRAERDAVELLYQVGQELSGAMEMEEVLPRVLALVVEKTAAYRGSIIVLDPMGNPRHHILVREDLSPSVIRLVVQEVLRRGLAGWVAQNRQPALVADTTQDPRWLELPETIRGVRSALAIPLLRGSSMVGVLTLVHREPGYFQQTHLQLVTSVANQAAIAIDNARLLLDTQRRVAQLNALLEINQGLSSDQSVEDLLELITFSAHGLLDASNTVLYLLDEAGKTLVPRVALGADSVVMRQTTLQAGEGLSGLVVQSRRSYILNEAHLSSVSKHVEGTPLEPEGLLAVPLLQREHALGVLAVSRYGEGVQFGPADQEIAELLASQAVVAINNARLYVEARRRADDMASLNRIARTVGSTLDRDEVLRQVIQELNRSFHVEAGSILLVDPERNDLFFVTTLEGGLERFLDVRIPMGVGIVGYVAQSAEPAVVNDPANDPRFYRKVSSDVGFVNRNIICVPLISRDRVIGVIELLNKAGGDFAPDDLDRLQGIAATVAVAIENAGLYQQTEEERGRLTAILISTADAIIATDAQQRILLINPAAAQAFGLDPEKCVGQPFQDAMTHEGLRHLFVRAQSIDHAFTDELTAAPRVGSSQTFYANIAPVRAAGGLTLGHVAVMQDITTLKELDKMKSEFVSVVSHDLKTPLTAIRGFADLVAITGSLTDQQREFVTRIKDITREMAAMISDLLDIGKIEAGIEMEKVPCNIQALAEEVISDLEFRAKEKQIVVDLEAAEPVATVTGDPNRLKQVLMNLVGNAIKYTPEGGHVWVRIGPEDDRLITAVKDTGIGISARDQKQLFQKFYRVRTEQTAHIEGTGLGLAIVRSIVEHHGGRIWVESEPGKGSTFAFSLLLTEAEQ
jgi:PAS domain S-box-containing protein